MSKAWPQELIDLIGVENIVRLRRLYKDEVEQFLVSFLDEPLSEEHYELVIGLAKDRGKQTIRGKSTAYEIAVKAQRTRSLFIASAWLAGASWNQVGLLFDIKRQSAMASGIRFLPIDQTERQESRISTEPVTLETLSAWYDWFMMNLDTIEVQDYTARKIASHLLTIKDE